MELVVVIGLLALVAVFMFPAIGINSARNLDGITHQFAADIENARLIAISERTRTRVLLPTDENQFTGGTTPIPWPATIARRGYLIASQKRTEPIWKQRGKWTRLPEGVALQSFGPTPIPAAMSIDVGGTGSVSYIFTGPYIEFLANGSSNLDPAASPAANATLATGFVNSGGGVTPTNAGLKSTVTVDPLTGSISIK